MRGVGCKFGSSCQTNRSRLFGKSPAAICKQFVGSSTLNLQNGTPALRVRLQEASRNPRDLPVYLLVVSNQAARKALSKEVEFDHLEQALGSGAWTGKRGFYRVDKGTICQQVGDAAIASCRTSHLLVFGLTTGWAFVDKRGHLARFLRGG